MTTSGYISYHRYALIPKNTQSAENMKAIGKKVIFPLDEVLGLDDLPFKITPLMLLEIAYWAVKFDSYQETEEYFRKKYGIVISDDTIRKTVNYIGGMIFNQDISNSNNTIEKLEKCRLDYTPTIDATLYILTDGSMINTRRKGSDGTTWRENKLGLVFSSDNIRFTKTKNGEQRHKIEKREYVSLLGTADEFKKVLFHTAVRNGYGKYKNVVILSDGATWIRNMKEELFPEAQQILDKFHVKENTYCFAKYIFKDKAEQYNPWAERICEKLDNGKWKDILEELEPYKCKNFGPGVVNLYTYLNNNRDNIDYPLYQKRGFFVGSGAIESGNKIAVQNRLKLPGMRWNDETAQCVLSIKEKIESKLWEKETVPLLLDIMTNCSV